MEIEICTSDIESVDAAIKGGADRIELCSALECGGLTPSAALLTRTIWKCSRLMKPIRVHMLIRPRTGDFFYSDNDLKVMIEDAAFALESGVDGLVFGALTSDGDIDDYVCSRILEVIEQYSRPDRKISTTFHRAFDFCKEPFKAMRKIARLGFDRILTSGQAAKAWEGRELIGRLVRETPEGLSIMAGGGINAENIIPLVKTTGIHEAHASAKLLYKSKMTFRKEDVNTGGVYNSDYARYQTDKNSVAHLIETIDKINNEK